MCYNIILHSGKRNEHTLSFHKLEIFFCVLKPILCQQLHAPSKTETPILPYQ